MASFVDALRDEVRRLARKEIKAETGTTAQAVARHRREIASLKRQLREQEKRVAFLESQERRRLAKPEVDVDESERVRFSARSVKAQRRRTGLSAADYGKLVGVSALTVYNWEQGKTRPRPQQLAALVALRGIGKREALAKLELLANESGTKDLGNGPPKKRRQRKQ